MRPISGHERVHVQRVWFLCTENTSPYAHTRTFSRCARLRTPDVSTHFAQGLDDSFVCFKNHSIIGHVFVECSFDPVSSYFLITFCLTDTTFCLSYAADGNQIKPLCNSARGWTVWPSGRSDPKPRLEPEICIDVCSEHTPINLPPRNMSFQQEYDATITASEDLNVPRHSGASAASIRQHAEFPLC